MDRLTTRSHLVDLIESIQGVIRQALCSGHFTAANDLRPELAWLSGQLGNKRYLPRPV